MTEPVEQTFEVDDGHSEKFDQDLMRIVTALGVEPATGDAVLMLCGSDGVQYSFADIIEALVARIAVFTDLLGGGRIQPGSPLPDGFDVGDDLSMPNLH